MNEITPTLPRFLDLKLYDKIQTHLKENIMLIRYLSIMKIQKIVLTIVWDEILNVCPPTV